MTDINLIDGSHDHSLIGMLMEHIEVPLRTLVALECVVVESLDSDASKEIAVAATENGVADLVTSALALITASWEQAGADYGIGSDVGTHPEVDAWCSTILDHALAHAKARWLILRLDYALNVGSIPKVGG